jgi:hypothetical protein
VTIRESKRFLTLVKSHALLCNRDTVTAKDIKEVEKFLTYSKPMLNATTAAYTRNEAAVMGVLGNGWKTIDEIKLEAKISDQRTRRAIHGRHGTVEKPDGGLLEKVKNLMTEYNSQTRKWSFRLG